MCYSSGMYKKGFRPGDIVYWIYKDEENPPELNIERVISIKRAKYLYKVKMKDKGKPCMVTDILKRNKEHKPIFFQTPGEFPGWMGEDEVFLFDKAAKVLYGTKETIDCARRLARKR